MTDAAREVILGALEGPDLSAEEARFFAREPLAGVTLFKRNTTPNFTVELAALNRRLLRFDTTAPAIIAIDQEGGRVSRLPQPFPNLGPAMSLFTTEPALDPVTAINQYGFVVGATLRALGINVNFAPVVDILTHPGNDAIGDRAFGKDADTVIARAGAFLEGMQRAGTAGCLKHFPGQGHAGADTHLTGASIGLSRAELDARELKPFKALLHATSMVMISHCIYPAFDTREASLSPVIMGELLRGTLGYSGLIVSDDMNMGAIAQDQSSWLEALAASLVAGADLLLICRHLDRMAAALDFLRAEARSSAAFAAVLNDRAARVRHFRKGLRAHE
jgi:beta-N-acetylhexosaminidase